MPDSMLTVFYAVNVKPELRRAFVDASIFEAQGVISEDPGVFQFHFMGDKDDPNRFYFYGVFRNKAAFEAHRDTDVYKNWWGAIEPMLAGDVETIAQMRSLFPTNKGFEAQKPGLLQW